MQLRINSSNVLYFKRRKPRVTPFSFCPTVFSLYWFHIIRVISTKRKKNKKKEGRITKVEEAKYNQSESVYHSQSNRADELASAAICTTKVRYRNQQSIANMITSTWIDSVELDSSSEEIQPAFTRLWFARFGHVLHPHTKSVSTERAKIAFADYIFVGIFFPCAFLNL